MFESPERQTDPSPCRHSQEYSKNNTTLELHVTLSISSCRSSSRGKFFKMERVDPVSPTLSSAQLKQWNQQRTHDDVVTLKNVRNAARFLSLIIEKPPDSHQARHWSQGCRLLRSWYEQQPFAILNRMESYLRRIVYNGKALSCAS